MLNHPPALPWPGLDSLFLRKSWQNPPPLMLLQVHIPSRLRYYCPLELQQIMQEGYLADFSNELKE